MKVSETGEFGLIGRLAKMAAQSEDQEQAAWQQLITGIGDDAAAYFSNNEVQLATVDSLVENVHFSLKYMSWQELGWKCIAVNLSDIAAMGGFPRYSLVSIGFPPETEVENILDLYCGMFAIAGKFGLAIVGGDTVSSPSLFISVTVLGSAGEKKRGMLRRGAAQPGDLIGVTNTLGGSAGGLEMLTKNLKFKPKLAKQLKQAHILPNPRVQEGQLLLAKGVRCGMDISDGLSGDMGHICAESKCGANIYIELVPVNAAAKECFGGRAQEMALTGGEDYELLFTAPPMIMEKVQKTAEFPVTVIGEVTAENAGKVTLTDSSGKQISLKKSGWDHFRK